MSLDLVLIIIWICAKYWIDGQDLNVKHLHPKCSNLDSWFIIQQAYSVKFIHFSLFLINMQHIYSNFLVQDLKIREKFEKIFKLWSFKNLKLKVFIKRLNDLCIFSKFLAL